jgi:hypothetical protein
MDADETEELTEEERKREEFKEKLRYWRESGPPINIPSNFRA